VPQFTAPVGTRDVLPAEAARWEALLGVFAGHVERAGYGLLVNPAFEDLAVFQRVGEGTDVVRKEMYDFLDKGGRRIALRPEGTASVVRAFVQHRPPTPFKAWYVAPCFRYERPQAGRLRQHHQLGVEVLGPGDPDVDVEVVALGWDYLTALGLRGLDLLVNSMGDRAGRSAYLDVLRRFLDANRGDLAPEDQEKVDDHPLRVLDSKRHASRSVVAGAPSILDHLSDDAAAHFERVQAGLRELGVPFRVEPRLVRGLDYYTHTTFEFQATALEAAQNTVMGGGRYDGLSEALGGPPTPGVGFGTGIERVLLACDAEGVFPAPPARLDAFVVDVTGGAHARSLTAELRRAGLAADRAWDGRSMKAQMKLADRSGAAVALIVGEDEAETGTVTVRPLRGGDQEVVKRDEVVDRLVRRATPAGPASS
jgi:histidyl-tRNA synthetase